MGAPKKTRRASSSAAAGAGSGAGGSARGPALKVLVPEGRKYACRECPARCCTSPWGIPVTSEERERIVSDPEALARLDDRARSILKAGVLPMRETEKKLACVFLDDDLLCSLQKRHGHAFIPAPCQAYPFGFSENEDGRPVALLSRYCPSIRDDRGEPVEPLLADKLVQAGGARPLGPKMGLRSGRVLGQKASGQVVEAWRERLRALGNPAAALAEIYASLDALDETLPKKKHLEPGEVALAVRAAGELGAKARASTPLVPSKSMPFNARILCAYLLGGLCYPSRVLLAHRTRRARWGERLSALGNRLAFLFGLGTVDLYLAGPNVPVRRIRGVDRFLSDDLGRIVSDYLAEVLLRRQGMARQTYFFRVLVDLGLMTLIISQHARAAAAGAGRKAVTEAEVREGIGIAELLFSHQGEGAQSVVLQALRLKLMASERDFLRLLASEA